jgi:hypothetical protein
MLNPPCLLDARENNSGQQRIVRRYEVYRVCVGARTQVTSQGGVTPEFRN